MVTRMKKKLMDFYQGLGSERSFYALCFAAFLVLLLGVTLNAFELLPEFHMPKNKAVEQNNSVSWLGMQVVPISRDIRTEFKLPPKVKGMFVSDAGLGEALKRGVVTGDVIVSVNGKTFKTLPLFIEVADSTRYYDGILLDVYRNGKNVYISIPFLYDYGPLMGPGQGRWQLGAPLIKQVLPYGRAKIMPNINWAPPKEQA